MLWCEAALSLTLMEQVDQPFASAAAADADPCAMDGEWLWAAQFSKCLDSLLA